MAVQRCHGPVHPCPARLSALIRQGNAGRVRLRGQPCATSGPAWGRTGPEHTSGTGPRRALLFQQMPTAASVLQTDLLREHVPPAGNACPRLAHHLQGTRTTSQPTTFRKHAPQASPPPSGNAHHRPAHHLQGTCTTGWPEPGRVMGRSPRCCRPGTGRGSCAG